MKNRDKIIEIYAQYHSRPKHPTMLIKWNRDANAIADEILASQHSVEEPPDIRLRVWIPYSLKYGFAYEPSVLTENLHEDTGRDYPLPDTYEWIEFVAINDPLQPLAPPETHGNNS
jgi:hypothetical protein